MEDGTGEDGTGEDGTGSAPEEMTLPSDYVAALLGDADARLALEQADSVAATPITFPQAWLMMRDHIMAQADESYGLAPTPVPPGHFDLHIGLMCHSLDALGALRRFVGVSQLLRPDLDVQLRVRRTLIEISVKLRGPSDPVRDIYHEVYAVVLHCALRWLTGEKIEASFVRAAPAPAHVATTFVDVLCCPVRRDGTGVSLVYPIEAGSIDVLPLRLGRLGAVPIGQFMRELRMMPSNRTDEGEPGTTATRVEAMLLRQIVGMEEVARDLGLSAATLRRRLADEDTSFRAILARIQKSTAIMLLESDQPMGDIAAELGFSDERSFRRACLGWFGETPGAYRHTLRTSALFSYSSERNCPAEE